MAKLKKHLINDYIVNTPNGLAKLAMKLEVSKSLIEKLRAGTYKAKVKQSVIRRLARALKVEVQELYEK